MRVMVLIMALLAAFRTTAAMGAAGPATLLVDSWRQYKDRFVTSAGRVVDNANGGISHSEGQGYAMLIAERLDDRPTFDAIWEWTQSNLLVRGDGLAAWRWTPQVPHVADHNNATDGDLLIAWALAEASDRWHVSEYRRFARQIVEALAANVVDGSTMTVPSAPINVPTATTVRQAPKRCRADLGRWEPAWLRPVLIVSTPLSPGDAREAPHHHIPTLHAAATRLPAGSESYHPRWKAASPMLRKVPPTGRRISVVVIGCVFTTT